jgi:SAM-dependent methyltransferase
MTTLISKTLRRVSRAAKRSVPFTRSIRASHAPTTSVSGHFYPYFEAELTRVVKNGDQTPSIDRDDHLPIPHTALFAGYGSDAASYVAVGRDQHRAMMEIMNQSGLALEPGARILDFGCAAGRMIRCFRNWASRYDIWGVDIRAGHILWCQQHLSPPFRFATTTTHPHLPFEDNSFSFIYACSVFTHIGDLEDAWLLELRRVLRPGGRLFATVHDNRTIDILVSSPPGHWLHDTSLRRQVLEIDAQSGILKPGFGMVCITIEPGNHQVFHDRDFLRRRWGQLFTIESIHPEGHGYQTAIVMSK